MAYEVIMPKNGMAMEEGKLIRWLKNVGDVIEKDEPLIEIETDKITMEEPAAASGILLAKWAEDGETVPVLEVIGWIGEKGEKPPEKPAGSGAAQEQASPVPVPAATPPKAAAAPVANGIPATPYAKKLASDAGIPLSAIIPGGRRGEIVAADVLAASRPTTAANSGKHAIDFAAVYGESVRKPMSAMRKAVARNMAIAWTIPSVTQNTRADVTELFALREQVNKNREEKISLNDFILKAVAKALTMHPEMLVSLDGDDVLWHNRVNLGVAVALKDGLIVPVIMDADKMGIGDISQKVRDLAARARNGGLLPHEYSGSTFTVSNLGMYEVETFSPIINPPNAAILGVCAAVDELALIDGAVVERKKMRLSLTYDHRLLDGATAGSFSMTVKKLLENPFAISL